MFSLTYLVKIVPYLFFLKLPIKKKMYHCAKLPLILAALFFALFFLLNHRLPSYLLDSAAAHQLLSVLFIAMTAFILYLTLDVPFFPLLFLVLFTKNHRDIMKLASFSLSPLLSSGNQRLTPEHLEVIFFMVSLPFFYLLFTKFLVPAVEKSQHFFFWKYIWLLPGCHYVVFRLAADPHSLSDELLAVSYFHRLAPFWISIICISYFLLFQFMSEALKSAQLNEKLYFSNLLTQMQKKQYTMLQKNTEETRKNLHDFKQQFILIKSCLEQGSADQAIQYLSQCVDHYSSGTECFCENYAIDSIIRYYVDMARTSNIPIKVSAVLPASIPVPELDFCTLLGNLMLNAVEACKRQTEGERQITLHITPASKQILVVTLSNTYEGEIKIKNGAFLSSKRASEGIGTMSAKSLAEKYNSTLNYSYNGQIFNASLLFLIPENKVKKL